MLITSSRKPSPSTRTLCKLLASFFSFEYFNRGKMGMGEVLENSHGSLLMIIGEYHGNPGSITVYGPDGSCALSIFMTLVASSAPYPRSRGKVPRVTGDGVLATALSDLLFSDEAYSVESNGSRGPLELVIADDRIEFMEDGTSLFALKVRSFKLLDGDVI